VKEDSCNEDLAFCKNEMDGGEEEDSELEKGMAALEDAAKQSMVTKICRRR
jgi:hypothetical protein